MEGSSEKKDVSPAPLLWGRPGQASEGAHPAVPQTHPADPLFLFQKGGWSV